MNMTNISQGAWARPVDVASPTVASQVGIEPRKPHSTGVDILASVWEDIVSGHLRPLHEWTTRDSVHFFARIHTGLAADALCPHEASLLRGILCGEPRKALAQEHGIASSTATGRYKRALAKIQLGGCAMPLVVVLAAQTHELSAQIPNVRARCVYHQGVVSISVPRPMTTTLTALTPAQQQVAQWLIEGGTRETIAKRRTRSVNTVSGQMHAVFHALRVTGRWALVRRARELGCFGAA
jgi:DNA-binding CsgD family transcriptional regulator